MKYRIVTPVSTEPITLAQAKLHLHMTASTLSGDTTTAQTIAPGSYSISTVTGATVDVLGQTTLVNLNAGTCGAGGSIAAKIQESDNGTSWSDFGTFTTVTTLNDKAVQEMDYTGNKQYIRVVAVVAGAACAFGADVIIMSGDDSEDTLISDLITAAREFCEERTRRALATQTIEAYLDRFPRSYEIELPKPPLQSVASVTYKDSDGNTTTMTADVDYIVDTESNIGRIVLPHAKLWPSFTAHPVNPIKIRYTAGYTALPKTIRQAMLLLIGHWNENREATKSNNYAVSTKLEYAVDSLLSLHKAGWF